MQRRLINSLIAASLMLGIATLLAWPLTRRTPLTLFHLTIDGNQSDIRWLSLHGGLVGFGHVRNSSPSTRLQLEKSILEAETKLVANNVKTKEVTRKSPLSREDRYQLSTLFAGSEAMAGSLLSLRARRDGLGAEARADPGIHMTRAGDVQFTSDAHIRNLIARGRVGFMKYHDDRTRTVRTYATAPLWSVAMLFAFPAVLRLTVALAGRRGRRRRAGRCVECGYDLRATPERCPECGHVPSPAVAAA